MPGRDVVASPVLVGRDQLLTLADRRLEAASGGQGHLLFLSGEAGIGKTRLLGSITRRAERSGFAVIRAAAFRGDIESSGGVLLDLAGDLRRANGAEANAIGDALSRRLREPVGSEGDPHRRRRLLVQDLADSLAVVQGQRPVLVVLEDLHWADQLSLEVIGHVATRLSTMATLVVGAYRSDELYPGTPMRDWRMRLVSGRLAEEVRLPRLTLAETATLISSLLGRPALGQLVTAVHDHSDGIPLHIEELLAVADETTGSLADPAVAALRVPDTLADAVLVRAQLMEPEVRGVAAAAAVIGRRFDYDLLTSVAEPQPDGVDAALRDLRSVHVIRAGDEPDSFDFRHALIRDALYGDIPVRRRRQLHERVAVAALERGYSDAFVSAHFDQAGRADAAYRHALIAAEAAVAVSAHREALQLFRRAARNLPPTTSLTEHARLLEALGVEAAAVDENAAAAEAFEEGHALWVQAGDQARAATLVAPLVAVEHLLGVGVAARVRRVQAALASLDDGAEADPVRAQLLAALAAVHLVNDDLDEAIARGGQSLALSTASGDTPASLDTAATLGSALVFAGQMDAGWSLLTDTVTRSAALLYEAETARGYRLIGSSASDLVEYDRAEEWLTRGIDYAGSVELWNHRNYMAAHLAHVQWACGAWGSAEQTALLALTDGRGGITTRITAETVLGFLALGRGDWSRADELLASALAAGQDMGELQRSSPPLWGAAEGALLRADHPRAIELSERGFTASHVVCDAAYLYPFLLTGTRARLALLDHEGAARWVDRGAEALGRRAIPGTLPAVEHARGLIFAATGDHDAARQSLERAAAAWQGRRRFWEGTWARLDLARVCFASRRYTEGAVLAGQAHEAAAAAGAVTLESAAQEVLQLLLRGREAQPWHPLTAREYAVATLVADGLTNRQIATQLVLSPKTVSAHVEHILTKLGAARRTEIAAWAARIDGPPDAG